MADTSTATENAAAADEAAELERLRAQLKIAHQQVREFAERCETDLETMRAQLAELSGPRRPVRSLAEVDADIVSVVRARYRAGCLGWLGEWLGELCRETTLPRSEHRYGPCSDGASPPAQPAGAAYSANSPNRCPRCNGWGYTIRHSTRRRADVTCGECDGSGIVDEPPPLTDPDPCGCEESDALQAKIRVALAHLQHQHCPQNNAYVMKAIEVLSS